MSAKVKITKQDMKEDKFTTAMLQTKEWFMEKWQIVVIAVAIVVVVIVAISYFADLRESKNYTGADLLNTANLKLRQRNYPEAITDLERIVDEYSGQIADKAQFGLANAHYESRNFDEAIKQYEEYIGKYHKDPIAIASSIAGIASCMENRQEFVSAGVKYEEAATYKPISPMAADYYLGAVRCFTLGGDREKAESALSELNEKYPNTKYSKTAARLIMGVVN